MRLCSCCALAALALAAFVALPHRSPVAPPQIPGTVPIVSFNIRYDTEERDERNNFRHRRQRIASFLNSTTAWLVGLQEALSSQVIDLTQLLPHYAALGYEGSGHSALPLSDPQREGDFKTGILYDTSKLQLLDHGHIWLSETPSVRSSKSWGSRGVRTATVGAFRAPGGQTVLLLNTHLDVWSASARLGQAGALLEAARHWQQRFPGAACFVTGDFNSAPGQAPHRLLVASFSDTWDACSADDSCIMEPFGATFHGWLGGIVDKPAMRLLQFQLLALHGSGIELPTHIPGTLREAAREVKKIGSQLVGHMPHVDLPGSWTRLHVDWLLFKGALPRGIYVGDVGDANFSSDHFPLVGVFDLEPGSG